MTTPAALKINQEHQSPNFTDKIIPVEFLVLHYTGGPLIESLDILCDPARKVSSHLVLGIDGTVFELVPCMQGQAKRAWHAGLSNFDVDGTHFENFNDFSIGIEIINLNGNLISYTGAQYDALSEITKQLQTHFPALKDPNRIVGHEHIAGYRGKSDPGYEFDWNKYYAQSFPGQQAPARPAICPKEVRAEIQEIVSNASAEEKSKAEFWFELSSQLESKLTSR